MAKTAELKMYSDELRQSLSDRLKRIEGQVRAIDRMVLEEKACPHVLHQLAATSAALHGVSTMMLRNYLENCVTAAIESGDTRRKNAVLDELMEVVKKFGQ